MNGWKRRWRVVLLSWMSTISATDAEPTSPIKRDEEVVFFATAARLTLDRTAWLAPIRGWVFEPERSDRLRRAFVEEFGFGLIAATPAQQPIFDERIRWFLVDNERGKRLVVRLGEQALTLDASDAGGQFRGEAHLPATPAATPTRLTITALLPIGDARSMTGSIWLLPPAGVSVISDIDDTIKETHVTDQRTMLANTFLAPFRPIPGMAARYRQWVNDGAFVHYVSNSPHHLCVPLRQFLHDAGFPDGTLDLRVVRLKDREQRQQLFDPTGKRDVIRRWLQEFPDRRFVLVGDTGERDPETYGQIAREFPAQIVAIFLRREGDTAANQDRMQNALRDIPPDRWRLFDHADELPTSLPGP